MPVSTPHVGMAVEHVQTRMAVARELMGKVGMEGIGIAVVDIVVADEEGVDIAVVDIVVNMAFGMVVVGAWSGIVGMFHNNLA
jgi:uncharacterized protein with von Willebrand factor type A (vWA) domain